MTETNKNNIRRKIGKAVREKGRFPTETEMCGILSYSPDQTQKYMKALEEDGVLIKKGDWYDFPEDKTEIVIEERHPIPVETVEIKIPERIGVFEDGIEAETEILEDGTEAFILPKPLINIPEPVTEPIEIYKEKKKEIKEKVKKKWFKFKDKPKKKESFLKQTKEDLALPMYIIRFVMLIVGTGSIIISIYYNIKLSMHFLPGIFAIISGCIFVLFAVVSFETIIYFIIYRMATWKKFIAISGFIFLWLIVTLFSVSAVLSGRFERYMLNEKSQYSDNRAVNAGRLRWQNVQEQKRDTEKQITEKRRQLEQLYKISEGIADLETRKENDEVFKNTQWRISIAEGDIRTLITKLDNIRKLELKQIEESPETTNADIRAGENDDFYTWVAGIFGTTKEITHFAISLFPAFFFDIVSSIAISVFLFLRKK